MREGCGAEVGAQTVEQPARSKEAQGGFRGADDRFLSSARAQATKSDGLRHSEKGYMKKEIEDRARDLIGLFKAEPSGFEELFTRDFLGGVPEEVLSQIFRSAHKQCGECRDVEAVGPNRFEYLFDRDWKVPAEVIVDRSPPHRIAGLRLGNPVPIVAG